MAGFYVQPKLRPCFIGKDNRKALFHCWEHFSEVIAPSPMVGGHPGGTLSFVRGVVEFEDGHVSTIAPENIKFVDIASEEYIWPEEES